MNIKEFFKPTIAKIIITIILFVLLIPITSCKWVKCAPEMVGSEECKGGCQLILGIFTGITLMESNQYVHFPAVFIPMIVALIVYYLLACIIVFTYNTIKK